MGSSGTSSQTTNNVPTELKPLFKQTGATVTDLQSQIVPQFDQFFGNQVQQIPGFTQGQQDIANFQKMRAFAPMLNSNEQAAQSQLMDMVNTPFGQMPMTQAAVAAAREPVLNDLALAGLGNSDAVGSNLAGAYAPIYAQEMALRAQAIPQLMNLGQTEAGRQSQLLQEYGTTQEAQRNITEAQGQATLADLLRRQGLGQSFTTGVLGGMPSISGSTTKSSGGK